MSMNVKVAYTDARANALVLEQTQLIHTHTQHTHAHRDCLCIDFSAVLLYTYVCVCIIAAIIFRFNFTFLFWLFFFCTLPRKAHLSYQLLRNEEKKIKRSQPTSSCCSQRKPEKVRSMPKTCANLCLH